MDSLSSSDNKWKMEFHRADLPTYRYLHLVGASLTAIAAGFSLYYLAWYWNFLLIPVFVLIVNRNVKRFFSLPNEVKSISIADSLIEFETLKGEKFSYKKEEVQYSLLVKKYIKPVRKIGFREVKKRGIWRKRKRIADLSVKKWPNSKEIAICLIRNQFSREKWSFDWSIGELILLLPFLLGFSALLEDNILGELSGEVGSSLIDIGAEIQDVESNKEHSVIDQTEQFVNRNQGTGHNPSHQK